ncbi:hypothetical protein V6N13_067596 [Hibiscus sabdariffa]|uniref:Uncharacterized protein n=1 Tax=Hibiscus sabdariffa TaxID=183260 RepID=A0ABR2DTW4_9ROSI
MNHNVEPPQPPQPHRPSTSCDRHPDEHFTGFCPSCLCERLAVLDPSCRKPPTGALKVIFKPSGQVGFPELRRTKSFSASKNEGFSRGFELQRKSCDVGARNTLCSLFCQGDERGNPNEKETAANGGSCEIVEFEARNLGSSSTVAQVPVLKTKR